MLPIARWIDYSPFFGYATLTVNILADGFSVAFIRNLNRLSPCASISQPLIQQVFKMTQATDIHAAIRATDDIFEATFAKGDSASLGNLYTDEALVMPTGAESAKGKAAISAFWQGAMDMGIKTATLEIQELEQHGDTVIDVGLYTLKSADDAVLDQGKYIVVWKNEDGNWKIHRDIFNSSLAPQ
jgi:ketosteroid isomerase-like protein